MSLNVQGLNTPEKCSHLLQEWHRHKTHIALLQETHFRIDWVPSLKSRCFRVAYHATNPTAKSKRVTILKTRDLPFVYSDSRIDDNGRYILLKGTLGFKKFTIANVYAPNSHHCTFASEICNVLMTFREGVTVLGGDFSVPLCPSLDTSSGSSSIPYKALTHMKADLSSLALHDTWHLFHPKVKDFSFFSHTQNKYSRLDNFFLSQPDIQLLQSASIAPMVISDHYPVTVIITLPGRDNHRTKVWRYDPTLLSDNLAH